MRGFREFILRHCLLILAIFFTLRNKCGRSEKINKKVQRVYKEKKTFEMKILMLFVSKAYYLKL